MNTLTLILVLLFQSKEVKHITIDPVKDREVVFYLSEISENLSYVKLETDERCMIGQIKILKQDRDKIFIVSQVGVTSRFYIFLNDGKFFCEIGRSGRGPGEFATITDFTLDRVDQSIYILDSMGRIYIYSYSGKFISSFRLDSRPHNILYANDAIFMFTAWPDYPLSKGYGIRIWQPGNKGNDVYLLNREYLNLKHHKGMLIYPNYFYHAGPNNTVEFYENKFDTLYSIDKNFKVCSRMVLNLIDDKPRDIFSPDEYNIAVKKYNSLSRLLRVKDNLFFTVMTPIKPRLAMFFYRLDLSTGELLKHDTMKGKEYIVNDIDGGLPFNPAGVAAEVTLYSALDCEKLKNQLLNGNGKANTEKKKKLIDLIGLADYSDNPIIMFVKIK